MESPIVGENPQANGNGLHKAAEPVQSPEPQQTTSTLSDSTLLPEQQRPRKLSFDDTDMELTKLKLGAAVRRFPPTLMLAAVAACVISSLLIRYLLPFDVDAMKGSLAAALATLAQWRQVVADRTWPAFDLNSWHVTLQEKMKDTQLQNPSLVLLATVLSIGVTWFTYFVVYLDSSIPGVNPPTPFSASKKKHFSDKERRFHLGYVTALLSGLTVFMIILLVD